MINILIINTFAPLKIIQNDKEIKYKEKVILKKKRIKKVIKVMTQVFA